MTRLRPAAVIFDYGNVLSAPQGEAEVAAMASILSVTVDDFRPAYWQFRVSYDEAALEPDDYWRKVAQQLFRTLTGQHIATLIEIDAQSWSYPAPLVPQWARAMRASGLKTALLSNMPTSVRDYILRSDWLPPFDLRVFSCDLRLAKPAAAIYQHCLNGLGVNPGDALLLDDRPENIQAAEALGLRGIVYRTAQQAAQEIVRRFDMPVPLVATLDESHAEDQ